MILESITKGNYNLELTKKTFKHENNLRFHVKIDERFYEYSIDTINKATINLQCCVSVVSIKIPFYIIFGPIFRKDLCGFHGIIV